MAGIPWRVILLIVLVIVVIIWLFPRREEGQAS
jgi:hypothetical protein